VSEAIEIEGTPQYKAYQWLLSNHSKVQNDEALLHLIQRFALASLYYTTNRGASWKNISAWLDGTVHECYWFGCTCTEGGILIGIDLQANGLKGGFVPGMDLALLRNSLRWLDLYNNRLNGKLPSELAQLNLMEDLRLWNNRFSGPLPSQLGDMMSLRDLLVQDMTVDGTLPTQLGRHSRLEYLDLSGNALRGAIPIVVGGMKSLEYLQLQDNRLTGFPSQVGTLSKLQYLILTNNDFQQTIPTEIGMLTSLTHCSWNTRTSISGMERSPAKLGCLPARKRCRSTIVF
jgi:hypothetical protein